MRAVTILALLLAVAAPVEAARPITLDDLLAFRRVSDPQPSPDGRWVVYVVTEVEYGENRTNADLWLVPSGGGSPRQLTRGPRHERHPRWSPDGQFIAFESNRSGETQVFVLPLAGGEPVQLTHLSTGASSPVWAPDGRSIAFVSAVFPEFSSKPFAESEPLNRSRLKQQEESKVKARVFDQLLYRHWDSWVDDRRQHLFVVSVTNGVAAGSPRDVTPIPNDAVPTSSTFSAGVEFAFSPDGRLLVHTATPTPTREEAWSTNHDLWAVDIATGNRRQLTTNPAADGLPRFSPDGRWLAYRAQKRPGFEADRWELKLLNPATGELRSPAPDFDTSIESLAWLPDGRGLLLEAELAGTKRIWRLDLDTNSPVALTSHGSSSDISVVGDTIAFTHARFTHPPDVFQMPLGGGIPINLSAANSPRLAELNLPAPESVTVSGAGGTPVQMWILRPPGFDPTRRYPLVFWVHGGPQGAFMDSWSTRWNPQVWAAQGWVIALPNPRGSTGFGQKFTDEISRDWGGKVFEDLMAALAHLEKLPYIDANRMAAAGASYGGYMMNWFQGHTDRFKTLVTHCGVYEFTSMYGTTEELWFDEWEHGIPWQDRDFDKWSPHHHAARFRTPNLIIHNELDFRVPIHQGLSLFTTLQRKGVPSRFLYFPDEGHWVLKPQNSERWHRTIFEWLGTYLK